MPVLIDKQVFVQIASGNKQASEALLKRLASGDPVPQAEDLTLARRLLGLEVAGGGKAFLQALRSTAYWKAVGKNFLEGMKYGLNPEALAGEVPFLVHHFGDKAAARDAIVNISVKFLKEGFRKGVTAGIARWTEDDVASNLFNRVTQFRIKDLGDPGGYLNQSFIFNLAQYKENYAIVVGYNYALSKSPDWKWKLYNEGVDTLKHQNYFFETDEDYYERFIDSLAYVLRAKIGTYDKNFALRAEKLGVNLAEETKAFTNGTVKIGQNDCRRRPRMP